MSSAHTSCSTSGRSEDLTEERDEEDRDVDVDRWNRYVETKGESIELLTNKPEDMKPFYNGQVLDRRMADIRKFIFYIRRNWEKYGEFLEELKTLLKEDGDVEFQDKKTRDLFTALVSKKREWLTEDTAATEEVDFEAIKLYTTQEGHGKIYRLCNNIFRQEDCLASPETVRSLVFLIELINIDLYNYCLKCPERSDFQGTVYRGMCLSEEELNTFKSLMKETIKGRDIASPLGLFSASACLGIAKKFIEHQMKQREADGKASFPLIIKIHVISLKPEYTAHYKNRFPDSVLTTLCAVDIHQISLHRKEREVLLRTFMLALDIYQDEAVTILNQPCSILEAVMVNTTRDHISVAFLGENDEEARQMFKAMVTVTKCEFAAEYCRTKGLVQDQREYMNIIQENKLTLERLMK